MYLYASGFIVVTTQSTCMYGEVLDMQQGNGVDLVALAPVCNDEQGEVIKACWPMSGTVASFALSAGLRGALNKAH